MTDQALTDLVASFYITETLKNKALKKNVFVLQRKGNFIESFLP